MVEEAVHSISLKPRQLLRNGPTDTKWTNWPNEQATIRSHFGMNVTCKQGWIPVSVLALTNLPHAWSCGQSLGDLQQIHKENIISIITFFVCFQSWRMRKVCRAWHLMEGRSIEMTFQPFQAVFHSERLNFNLFCPQSTLDNGCYLSKWKIKRRKKKKR